MNSLNIKKEITEISIKCQKENEDSLVISKEIKRERNNIYLFETKISEANVDKYVAISKADLLAVLKLIENQEF